jgi:hypothetical protein
LLAFTALGVAVSISPRSRSTVITAPVLRLDRGPDRARLWETAKRLRPGLLCLDPLVRLHGIDENNAGEGAELLAYFRSLQRQLDLSVLLGHQTRRNAREHLPPVRDCAAPVTSMPSVTRTCISGEARNPGAPGLVSEHRTAPASAPVHLELVATDAKTTHLKVIAELQGGNGKRRSLEERVLALLAQGVVLTRAKLCDPLAVQNERLGDALESLERAGRLCRTPAGRRRLN